MPNRQLTGAEGYRYGYQGEYAETDPETQKPAFELRLYDPRINRWLAPDPYGQHNSPYLSMGNNWVSRVDPDGGFDTWIGAFLYRLLNGGGGEIFKNDSGQFGIDRTGQEGVELMYGFNWERSLEGPFEVFNKNDITFAQFGADPAIATTLRSNLSLIIDKNKTNRQVNPSDYNFRVTLNSKSSDSRVSRKNGSISSALKFKFNDGSKEMRELKYIPPNYKKGEYYLTDAAMLPTVETSFRINSHNDRFKISLHRLNWFYQGNEPGAHIGTKFGIPAGIDPIFGGLSFGGRITLFGE